MRSLDLSRRHAVWKEGRKMVIHYIVLSSSYSTRSRIALHRAYHKRIDHSEVGPMI